MVGHAPDRHGMMAGAAALLLLPFFLWAAIFADKRYRGWWIGIAALLLLAVGRELSRRKRRPPLA